MTAGKTHRGWVFASLAIVLAMNGLAYASVPAYRAFCQQFGFAGTPRIADQSAARILDRRMEVRFNGDTARGLAWDFTPAQVAVTLPVGETGLAYFEAVNRGAETITGTATFNVTPLKAAKYFVKVACFCFTEQVLAAGETARMPVTFFVDPAIADDSKMDDIETVTLSYTFFPAPDRQGGRQVDHQGGRQVDSRGDGQRNAERNDRRVAAALQN